MAVRESIREKDAEILSFADSIAGVIRRLEAEIYEVSKPLLGQQKRLAEPVATGDILELSRKLSYSTAAPSGWHFSHNREIPVPFRPPAPQEENMKKGLLFTDTTVLLKGLKQSREMGKEKEKEEEEVEEKKETREEKVVEEAEKGGKKRPRAPSKQGSVPSAKKMKKQSSTFDLDVSSSEGEE